MDSNVMRKTAKVLLKDIRNFLLLIAMLIGITALMGSIIFVFIYTIFTVYGVPVDPNIPWYLFFGAYGAIGSALIAGIALWINGAHTKAKDDMRKDQDQQKRLKR